jgi:glutamate 5-kinase
MLDAAGDGRSALKKARRIVVKVGTRTLVDKNGRPNKRRIACIASQLAQLRQAGKEIILVSSGAVGAGLQALGFKHKPRSLPELQMAASVGQTCLLQIYSEYFKKSGCQISQVLLTHADLKHRGRHLNIRNTLLKLLQHKVVPIINENDVISVDEIRVGDNDILSALVSVLVDADLLLILTSVDGLRQSSPKGKTRRVKYLPKVTQKTFQWVTKKSEALSTGGMHTKLKAAQIAEKSGVLVVIAPGHKKSVIERVVDGADIGTLIGQQRLQDTLVKRKRWIHYFHRSQGKIIVDAGAVAVLQRKGKSLLPAGILKTHGQFSLGDLVEIIGPRNKKLGHGLVEYSHRDIEKIKGQSSAAIENILGFKVADVVIHCDNMIIDEDHV